MQLREYQSEAIDALSERWDADGRRLAVVLPTGAGKTVIFSALAREYARHSRVIILVHRDELASQTVDKLRRLLPPGVTIGRVQAQHRDLNARVVVASIQTLTRPNRLAELLRYRPFALGVADECHHAASDGWVAVMDALDEHHERHSEGRMRWAGFTATMSRADNRGLGDVWEEVVYSRGIRYMIEHGYLVPPVGKTLAAIDTSKVRVSRGDYAVGELGIKVATDVMRTAVVKGYHEHAADRSGILFAPTVDAAEFFRQGLVDSGITAEGVYAGVHPRDRAAIYERVQKGTTQVLTSCTALTEGFDLPRISAAVLCRPTLHAGLYVQQIGRALRPWPGKTNAVILDAAGASQRHSLDALIELHETPPPIDSTDDEQLDEIEPEGAAPESAWRYRGPAEFVDVDLWGSTNVRWLTTTGGVLFAHAGAHLVFVVPQDGAWAVGMCDHHNLRFGRWLSHALTSDDALRMASDYVTGAGAYAADAPWRSKGRPSVAQRAYADKLGIDHNGMTRGQISDAIDVRVASRTLHSIGNGS
jgi:superfamily II DNA or RNA helicase